MDGRSPRTLDLYSGGAITAAGRHGLTRRHVHADGGQQIFARRQILYMEATVVANLGDVQNRTCFVIGSLDKDRWFLGAGHSSFATIPSTAPTWSVRIISSGGLPPSNTLTGAPRAD